MLMTRIDDPNLVEAFKHDHSSLKLVHDISLNFGKSKAAAWFAVNEFPILRGELDEYLSGSEPEKTPVLLSVASLG